MISFRRSLLQTLALAAVLLSAQFAAAQSGEYHEPLNEKLPPGFTAETLARVRHYDPHYLQPVRVELPSDGEISVYSASPDPLATFRTPAQFSVNAGHLYRLRISGMPEFPGVEIYPSVEILDRLHPPAGAAASFPIPIVLTEADLQEAIEGRLVTRVIYLENPRKAAAVDPLRRQSPVTVSPAQNALQEAGRLGRPMMIVRIGGRVPSGHGMPLSWFGTGGAFDPGQSLSVNTGVVKLSDKPSDNSSLAGRLK